MPLEEMRIECGVSRNGSNARNILRAGKKFGLEVHGYRKEIDGLLKLPVPSIIHWEFNHFVVFEGVKGKYFYINDPSEGRRRLTMEELDEGLSGSISFVSQNITLFSGNIRDNLTMWNRNISETDLIKAAKDACIHDVITARPLAYDSPVLDDGANFSGGQKQRLEIARALATNPSILIMDEATSALDPITEKEIMDNIKRRGCTCIIVAHRLSAIRDCDEIIPCGI
ncbi:MAG: ATP-binding cassette domain-containing protein [Butyrivibrio sp.]|nr:ATP-binding cassette domain-containing protein [Butyrivibrio sp.]